MTQRYKRLILRLGHFQAQLLLTLLFVLFLAPYAIFLRLFGLARLPDGRWQESEPGQSVLARLRRTF